MRIAWDLQAVTGPRPTGLGVSVQLLLDALLTHQPQAEVLGLRPNERNQPLATVPDRLCWEQWRLPRRVAALPLQERPDLLYSPALGAPLRCAVPVVAHVHDLIALRYPAQFSGVSGWYWKRLLPAGWKRCRAITVSNASVADELVDLLSYPRDRISIVPYYPDPRLAEIAAGLQGRASNDPADSLVQRPQFITLGSHEPRKNLELPIRALAQLRSTGFDARLRCIGMHTAHTASLIELARSLGVEAVIEFPDYLSREQIADAMLGCSGLLFTSSYEGYGMPPQEAQSIGCPVVLSDIPCHRAVYADSVRLQQLPPELREPPPFVDADDSAGLALQMRRLVEDSLWRERLTASGLSYSATFSAQATALALRKAFERVLA